MEENNFQGIAYGLSLVIMRVLKFCFAINVYFHASANGIGNEVL